MSWFIDDEKERQCECQKKTFKEEGNEERQPEKWSGSGYRGQLNANAWGPETPESKEEVATTSGQRGNLGHEDKNQFFLIKGKEDSKFIIV